MLWFRPGYLKEGPGIEKDAPPKTGLALFFEILVREFWQLLKLNLLFVICALPLVTFGAARAALSRCTMNMVRDVPNDVWDDFRQELKKDFSRNTALGLLELFALGMLMLLLSLPGIRSNTVACVVLLALTAIVVLVLGYLWPMVVAVDVPLRAAIKNAAVLALAFPQHSLPALVVALLLYGLSFWLFPLSLPLVLFVPFGMGSFVTSFAAWSDIRRLVIRQNNR
ncbi:MAG TPA: DUF624 domain-containing protein [Candidatus Agathobaculum intestinipullorum]|nr:DUF624 domain-containing protein [uncultured Agathobaculum sp.]HJA49128.1 DUF624 domain-containing protein [Candidatus Agathobaculum intestinipullorum]